MESSTFILQLQSSLKFTHPLYRNVFFLLLCTPLARPTKYSGPHYYNRLNAPREGTQPEIFASLTSTAMGSGDGRFYSGHHEAFFPT